MKDLPQKLRIYLYCLYVLALALLVYLIITSSHLPWGWVIFFGLVSMLAEFSLVSLPLIGATSVGFTITFASLILFGPLAAVTVDLFASVTWRDIKEKSPWYRITFNVAQFIISAGLAGLVYVYTGGLVLYRINRNFVTGDFPRVLLPLFLSTFCYLVINTSLVPICYAFLKKISPLNAWLFNAKATVVNYFTFGAFGIVLAQVFMLPGVRAWGIVLLIAPLFVAREVLQRYMKLREIYWSSVRALVKAVEIKDKYTKGHSERVAEYAEKIGRRLKLREDEIENLCYAGYLHDLGKLGIPRRVLNKVEKLTEEEYEIVKKHPESGTSILERVTFLDRVLPAIRYHHENVSGTGYNHGLVGESIPLAARILAVADAYDAMTSDRAYRQAMSPEGATEELLRGSDIQFDRKIVEVFLDALKEEGVISGISSGEEGAEVATGAVEAT